MGGEAAAGGSRRSRRFDLQIAGGYKIFTRFSVAGVEAG
jgi:hypothetical protein